MDTNAVPHFDDSVNTTGCCPKFNPEGWDGQELHFEGKPFVRAETRSVMHIPVNMGSVFGRVSQHIEDAKAYDPDDFIVLSRDLSSWKAEHLFSAPKPVPGETPATLSGSRFYGPIPREQSEKCQPHHLRGHPHYHCHYQHDH